MRSPDRTLRHSPVQDGGPLPTLHPLTPQSPYPTPASPSPSQTSRSEDHYFPPAPGTPGHAPFPSHSASYTHQQLPSSPAREVVGKHAPYLPSGNPGIPSSRPAQDTLPLSRDSTATANPLLPRIGGRGVTSAAALSKFRRGTPAPFHK